MLIFWNKIKTLEVHAAQYLWWMNFVRWFLSIYFVSNAHIWSNQLVLEVYCLERKIFHLQLLSWLIMLVYLKDFMSNTYSVILMLMSLYIY